MPFSHETYKLCIGLGMPEGLSGDDQHSWFVAYLKEQQRRQERARASLCDVFDYGIRKGRFSEFSDIEDIVDAVMKCPGKHAVDYFAVFDEA